MFYVKRKYAEQGDRQGHLFAYKMAKIKLFLLVKKTIHGV